MLLNQQGLVWIGRRFQQQNDDGVGHWWQMPQGGIDEGEDPAVAAIRELEEETAVRSAKIIAEAPGWYNYDLPEHLIGLSWKGRYRGQTQKWFAARFTGNDRINHRPRPQAGIRPMARAKMNEMSTSSCPSRSRSMKSQAAFRHLACHDFTSF
jgi:putative (di)nucleoside polyphosphate hydrolase